MLVSVGSSRPSFFVLGGEKPTSNTAHRHTVDAGKKHRAARFLPNQYVESRPSSLGPSLETRSAPAISEIIVVFDNRSFPSQFSGIANP
jgi:hypothetical protein